ncbi:MAG: recombinase family protein, partial [Chloroflexota bacterium]|nr:recombinase family protein [Chloroflexota bacterium]
MSDISQEGAAKYGRVSTAGQENDSTSLLTQEVRNEGYCRERAYRVVLAEQDVASGFSLDGRNGLERLLEAAKQGHFDVLVFYDLDRLARNDKLQGYLIYRFEEAGVRVESVTQDLNGSAGIFVRAMAAAYAYIEREKIRERTMRGKAARLSDGNAPTWSCDLYGYRTFRPSKEERREHPGLRAHRIVVTEEAEVVQEVYRLVAEGWAFQRIADLLNERGVPSPGVSRMRYKDGRRPLWRASSIAQMVPNPAYKGLTVANRLTRVRYRNPETGKVNPRRQVERPEEEWTIVEGDLTPALISPEEWARANERVPDRRGFRTRNQFRPMLLRGRLVCSECAAPLYADHASKPGRRNYYRCRNAKAGKSGAIYGRGTVGCKVAVPADSTDEWVWGAVEQVLRERDRVAAEIRRRLDRPAPPGLAEESERLATRLREIGAGQQRLLEREGTIAWEVIEERVNALETEKATVRARLTAIEAALAGRQSERVRLEGLEELVRRLGPRLADPDIDTKSLVLDELGVRVLVSRRMQKLEWGLPLPAGDESGWSACLDFSGVGEPSPEQVAETKRLQDEAWLDAYRAGE